MAKARPIGIMITLLIMTGLAGYAVYIAHSSDGKITSPATEAVPAG